MELAGQNRYTLLFRRGEACCKSLFGEVSDRYQEVTKKLNVLNHLLISMDGNLVGSSCRSDGDTWQYSLLGEVRF